MFLSVVLSIVPISMGGCSKDPEERGIRKVIEGMRTAAENKDFEKTLEPVSADYLDNLNGTRSVAGERMNQAFAPYDRLRIKAPIQKIERNGLSAVAELKVFVLGTTGDRKEFLFGSPITPKRVELFLDKREGLWRVTGSRIER
jgi:hypothetical protein